MDTENFVIVIGREYGSGGRNLGQRLAHDLGVRYYDKELLSAAAERMGFSHDIFQRVDECKPSAIRNFLGMSYGVSDSYPSSSMSCESLYAAQCEVIRRICEEGSCVIVGRTADHIMRNHPRLVSIFVHAPESYRVRRVIESGECTVEEEARELIRKRDRKREGYYNYYTGRSWGRGANYHLCIDSSVIDADTLCGLVKTYLAARRPGPMEIRRK